MSIPPSITTLVERLNQELAQIEQEATEALRFARISLERFPNNFTIVQLYAFINTTLFFVDNSRRKIQHNLEYFSSTNIITEERVQEVGEDLAMELGRVLETKLSVINIKNRLENLL